MLPITQPRRARRRTFQPGGHIPGAPATPTQSNSRSRTARGHIADTSDACYHRPTTQISREIQAPDHGTDNRRAPEVSPEKYMHVYGQFKTPDDQCRIARTPRCLLLSAALIRAPSRSMEPRPRISPLARAVAAFAAVAVAALGTLAARLTPDQRGWGTHEQLGFDTCAVRTWTGRPCPTCGMTTAWAYAVRGNAQAAVAANAGGAMLFVTALAVAAWSTASAAAGRWLLAAPSARWGLVIATVWLVVTLADWVHRLISQ